MRKIKWNVLYRLSIFAHAIILQLKVPFDVVPSIEYIYYAETICLNEKSDGI